MRPAHATFKVGFLLFLSAMVFCGSLLPFADDASRKGLALMAGNDSGRKPETKDVLQTELERRGLKSPREMAISCGFLALVVAGGIFCYRFRSFEIHGALAWIAWGSCWGTIGGFVVQIGVIFIIVRWQLWGSLVYLKATFFAVPTGLLLGCLAGMWVYLCQASRGNEQGRENK